ncbi:hypothetical protein AMK34_11165 [Amycolatopsis sp. CB00013]|nr:hypothetical protein AMK34_11165 [Amycolatopsis sp. CB00013]
MTLLDKIFRRLTRVMVTANRALLRRRYIYSDVATLIEYGYTDEEVERMHDQLVSRFALPVTLLLCSTLVVPVALAPMLNLADIWFEVERGVVNFFFFAPVALVLLMKMLSAESRILMDVRVILGALSTMRRCHMVESCFAPSGVIVIEAARASTKQTLRLRARSLRKNVAKSAGREPGEPGFERCEYLAVWLYWASDDLDDETRVHRAIRACGQMLQHYTGPTAWLIPEIAKPPAGASVVPPTPFQRVRSTAARAIQAGPLTAMLGLLAAVVAFAAKIL